MREYPKRFGNEYYPSREKRFVTKEDGGEVYARDKFGNELYPKRKYNTFARDRTRKPYYARYKEGNQYYPVIKNQSILLKDPVTNCFRFALNRDGSQRYPVDDRGNEYYLVEDGMPYLLRKKDGTPYLAKCRQGTEMIPWNYINQYIKTDKSYLYVKDSVGNSVYVDESNVSTVMKVVSALRKMR